MKHETALEVGVLEGGGGGGANFFFKLVKYSVKL